MKKFISFALIVAVALSFSACTGSERLKNMTIVQGLALDVEKGRVVATLQYLELNKSQGTNDGVCGNITSDVSAKGFSINSAVKSAGRKLPDALFFGQNKLIIISADFEKQYGDELRDYLVKNKESRPDVFILKTKRNAADILKDAQKDTLVPADSVCKQLEKLHRDVTVSEFLAGDAPPFYEKL